MPHAMLRHAFALLVTVAAAACASSGGGATTNDGGLDQADAVCPSVAGDAPPVGACAHVGACLQVRGRFVCPDGTTYEGGRVWDCTCQAGQWQCAETGGLSIPDCLLDAGPPPADAGCTPHTCAALGYQCGGADDGCGHPLDCGTCGECQSCGGSGVPHVCGGGGCCPRKCDATTCGLMPDGCGGALDCGACAPGLSCGAGGVPNRCGAIVDAGGGG